MKKFPFIKVIFDKINYWLFLLENRIDTYPMFIRALCVGFGAWALSMFFYMQQYFSFANLDKSGRAIDFLKMCSDPLSRELREPILAYRIVTPAIAWLFGLHSSLALILPTFFMIILLSMLYVVCYRKIGRDLAVLTTLGMAFTQVTLWNNAHVGVPDAVTHLAVVLCLFFSNMFAIAGLTLLGIMNDERFVIAIPFIILWHINLSNLRLNWPKMQHVALGLIGGVLLSLIFRHALTVGWIGEGIQLPQVYRDIATMFSNSINFIFSHKSWFAVNYFMSFRWLWILPIACLAVASGDMRLYFIFLWLLILAVLFASSLVWDVSRSIAFSFPVILISIRFLYEYNQKLCRRLLIVSVLFCMLTPAFFLGPGGMQLYLPLPFILLKWFTGFDIVDVIRTRGHGTFGIH